MFVTRLVLTIVGASLVKVRAVAEVQVIWPLGSVFHSGALPVSQVYAVFGSFCTSGMAFGVRNRRLAISVGRVAQTDVRACVRFRSCLIGFHFFGL